MKKQKIDILYTDRRRGPTIWHAQNQCVWNMIFADLWLDLIVLLALGKYNCFGTKSYFFGIKFALCTWPLSIVPLSIVHCPLSIVHCPLSIVQESSLEGQDVLCVHSAQIWYYIWHILTLFTNDSSQTGNRSKLQHFQSSKAINLHREFLHFDWNFAPNCWTIFRHICVRCWQKRKIKKRMEEANIMESMTWLRRIDPNEFWENPTNP